MARSLANLVLLLVLRNINKRLVKFRAFLLHPVALQTSGRCIIFVRRFNEYSMFKLPTEKLELECTDI
jgi:hypothetical protein